MQRLVNSAKIYRMEMPYTVEELSAAMVELVRVNKMASCYIRPIALRGYGDIGVGRLDVPTEIYMACWEWGTLSGRRSHRKWCGRVHLRGIAWRPTLARMAKAGANYMNSQLIRMEANANGYSEGIALDANGYVSEGSGENIFVVRDGALTRRRSEPACCPASPATR